MCKKSGKGKSTMKTGKVFLAMISLLIVFVLLFSALFILAEADHDCSGEDCAVCRIIMIAEESLKKLSVIFCVIALAFSSLLTATAPRRAIAPCFSRFTPVLLKVKLSN